MSWGQGSRWAACAGILALALAARLAAGAWWQDRLPAGQRFAFGDSESYWVLAQALARGEPFQYGEAEMRIFRTPGYPALLAGWFRLTGDLDPPAWSGRVLSAVCGTLAVAAVLVLGWRMFGPGAGLCAGLLAAVHPEAVSLGVFILSEAPFHPLLVWQLVCWREAWVAATPSADPAAPRHARLWALAAGVCAGLATLMRPSWLLFSPYVLGLSLVAPAGRRRGWQVGLPLLVGLILVMAPWWWRNYRLTGRFVPTTLQVGASLYDGWRPDAEGGSDMRFVARFIEEQRSADAASTTPLTGTFEERLDRRQRDAALDWARNHPARVAELVWIKLVRMWSPVPNAAEMSSGTLRIVTAVGLLPLLLLAAWQTARRWRSGDFVLPLWLPALYLTNLHVIFVSSLRYRQPALLPLLVLAAGGIVACWDRRPGAGGRP
ncbi:MAG: glycosyltransferase family 39 protein [Pirellulales bacterium]